MIIKNPDCSFPCKLWKVYRCTQDCYDKPCFVCASCDRKNICDTFAGICKNLDLLPKLVKEDKVVSFPINHIPENKWIEVCENTFKLKVDSGWIYRYNSNMIYIKGEN